MLLVFVFASASNAYALKFTGDAWFAHHEGSQEYYLVIKNSGLDIDPSKVKLKGFKFKADPIERDFYALTHQHQSDDVTWFQIDADRSRPLKKYQRKAARKAQRLIKKGVLDEADRMEWMEAFVNQKLEDRMYRLIFSGGDGDRYTANIAYALFQNPVETFEDDPAGGGANTPVPEPTTMLLLGSGLLGLAAVRKRRR
jgi:hypothetical protein